eukprot:m.104604 g.104604  ORF g.104604 m.104604 type:complete len:294 (+) comp20954_c0_seq1:47-928(+)
MAAAGVTSAGVSGDCVSGSTPPPPAGYEGDGGAAEWAARVELAHAYHTVAKLGQADWGWTHCVYNHITVKCPPTCCDALGVPGPVFLINPFGCRFDEVTPASLHTVDLAGTVVRRGAPILGVIDRGVLLAGFTIHSAVHAARPDIKAVFHTHHPDVVAVSALRCGLLPCSNEGCLSLAVLSKSRHPFEGTATDPSEKERLASALGPTAMSLLLNNHGVVCCGVTVPQALRNIWVFTKAATYQVRALSAAGGDVDRLVMPSAEVVDVCLARELKQQDAPLGQVEFDAWLRGSAI